MRVIAIAAAAVVILVCAGGATAGDELWVSSDLTLTADHDGVVPLWRSWEEDPAASRVPEPEAPP